MDDLFNRPLGPISIILNFSIFFWWKLISKNNLRSFDENWRNTSLISTRWIESAPPPPASFRVFCHHNYFFSVKCVLHFALCDIFFFAQAIYILNKFSSPVRFKFSFENMLDIWQSVSSKFLRISKEPIFIFSKHLHYAI